MLWQFNLHYFNYLFLLNKEEQLNVCHNWINNNPAVSSVGWHPYVVSLRIVNWCKCRIKDEAVNKSIYQQAYYLYRNLEYYHPANHYLENARALIFAGLYFNEQGEAKKWLSKGLEIYRNETQAQIINDGVYFEKSVMYHALMLQGYLDVLNILPEDDTNKELFYTASRKMLTFLTSATHPDGSIALLNDSTQEIAPSTKELTEYATSIEVSNNNNEKPSCTKAFAKSCFYVYRDNEIYLIIDGGSIGPDNIPAHAHADIFSYEFSVKSKQFIVDSGVYEYKPGEMRDYVRSTKAHNTISIDGVDQAEMWGSFRVARRYKPYDVVFKETGKQVLFEGKLGGYSKLIGDDLIHQRKIIVEKNSATLSFEDSISGKGTHYIQSHIHLHPDVKIQNNNSYLFLTRDNIRIELSIVNCSLTIEDSWYCPEFGRKIQNKVLVLKSNEVPCQFGYAISEKSLE